MSRENVASLVDLRHRQVWAPELRGLVRGLVSVRVASERALYTVPHGSLALSLQLGRALGSEEPTGLVWRGSALTGLRTRAVAYAARPETLTAVALLSPRGAYRVLAGLNPAAFTERREALAALLSQRLLRTWRTSLAETWSSDPLPVLERALSALCADSTRTLPLAARRAFRAHELVREHVVRDLAMLTSMLEVSRRQLERDCRSWLGLTLKELFARRRLQQALRALQAGESLARCAARAGFADQAHMAHVLKRVTGRPPSAWASTAPTALGHAYVEASGGELVTL